MILLHSHHPEKAPLSSTEKCPDNVEMDKNGNCSSSAQMPDENKDVGNNNIKPALRGNLLKDLMFSQSQDSSTSVEQE